MNTYLCHKAEQIMLQEAEHGIGGRKKLAICACPILGCIVFKWTAPYKTSKADLSYFGVSHLARGAEEIHLHVILYRFFFS